MYSQWHEKKVKDLKSALNVMSATRLNSLPNDTILDRSKLKAFADDNSNVYRKLKFALGRVENIVGKGENAGNQHFLLFPQCFQKASSLGSLKDGIVWYRVKTMAISKDRHFDLSL